MPVTNNPAGRLRAIVSDGKAQKKDQSAVDAWAKLLDVPKSDKARLLSRIGDVMSLPSVIHQQVSTIESVDPNVYLKWLPKVEAAFGVLNFQTKWQQFIDRFTEDVEFGLDVCSDLLSRNYPERELDSEQFQELYSAIDDLLQQACDANDIPQPVSDFIIERLIQMREALDTYKVLGVGPIERELHATIGSAVANPELHNRVRETNFGGRFWKIMGRIAIILTITMSAVQISHDTQLLLPGETDPDDDNSESQ